MIFATLLIAVAIKDFTLHYEKESELRMERQQLRKHLQLSSQVIRRLHVGKKGMGLHEFVLSVLTCKGLVDETLDIAPLRKVWCGLTAALTYPIPSHPIFNA